MNAPSMVELASQLDCIRLATMVQIDQHGTCRGAEPGPVTAFMEAVQTQICEGMPQHSREVMWARQPEHDHLRNLEYAEWNPRTVATEAVAQEVTDTRGWNMDDWISWCRRTHSRLFPGEVEADSIDQGSRFKRSDNIIVSGVDVIETVPAPLVEQYLRELLPVALDANHDIARSLMIEYLVAMVHPFMDGNGRISRLMGNLVSPGRTVPASLRHHEYCQGMQKIRETGIAVPWVTLRLQLHRDSGRMPTNSVADAIDWWGERFYTWDPGTRNPEELEHYTQWTLVDLRKRREAEQAELATNETPNRRHLRHEQPQTRNLGSDEAGRARALVGQIGQGA